MKFYEDYQSFIQLKNANPKSLSRRLNLLLKLWINTYTLFNFIREQKFDIVYMRYMPWSPSLHLISQVSKLVIEINGDETSEALKRSTFTYIYTKITKPLMFISAIAFVSVSNELAKKNEKFKNNFIVIANGYEQQPNDLYHSEDKIIKIGFIGTNQSWHGLDKLLELAQKLQDFEFHIIGDINQISHLPNVHYYGHIDNLEAKRILKNCDIGISSLALHRINLNEASPLKSREYLALSLPIVIAYEDTDLPGSYPFVFKIENTENNIKDNADKIREFCVKTKGNKAIRDQASTYFDRYIQTNQKELKRINFFKLLTNDIF
jgi:glycosyltransferase involved in cell wall biosynthesis